MMHIDVVIQNRRRMFMEVFTGLDICGCFKERVRETGRKGNSSSS